MNKNTIIGLVLIIGIMAIFSYINRPSEAEIKKRQHEQDSIALALKKNDSIAVAESKIKKLKSDSLKTDTGSVKTSNDSSVSVKQKDELGIFAGSAQGEKKTIIVENEIAKFKFNTFGGGICYIQLKNYKTFDKNSTVLGFVVSSKIYFGLPISAIIPSSINTTLLATSFAKPIS